MTSLELDSPCAFLYHDVYSDVWFVDQEPDVTSATSLIDKQTKEIQLSCDKDLLNSADSFLVLRTTELHDVGTDQFYDEPSNGICKRKRITDPSSTNIGLSHETNNNIDFPVKDEVEFLVQGTDDLYEHEGNPPLIYQDYEDYELDLNSSALDGVMSLAGLDSPDYSQVGSWAASNLDAMETNDGLNYLTPRKVKRNKPEAPRTPCKSESSGAVDNQQRVDNRGKHWASKVEEGRPPEPWKDTQVWAERRRAKEAEFDALVRGAAPGDPVAKWSLPWRARGCRPTGNTQKVLYIELMMHQARGVAALRAADDGGGFFGIGRVEVPLAGRGAFDAGIVPSPDSSRLPAAEATPESRARLKALVKIWETAGFRERQLAGGALELVYDSAVFSKQKQQQTCKRSRAA